MWLSQNLLMAGAVGGANIDFDFSIRDFVQSVDETTTLSETIDIGPVADAGKKRVLVLLQGGASFSQNRNITPTSFTVAGVEATKAIDALSPSSSFRQYVSIHYIEYPNNTDTTANLTVSVGNLAGLGVQVLTVYVDEDADISVYSSDADVVYSSGFSVEVDRPENSSLSVAVAQMRNGEATPSLSFGGTLVVDTFVRGDLLSDENFYGGVSKKTNQTPALARTVTFNDTSADNAESVLIGAILVFNYP